MRGQSAISSDPSTTGVEELTEAGLRDVDEISPIALGATIVRHRWRIAAWMAAGALVMLPTVVWTTTLYRASASFIPQGYDAARTGLAGLAGQFGVSVPGTSQALSPEFYEKLINSRVLLTPIVRDTLEVQELGGRRFPLLDLFEVPGQTVASREEQGVAMLANMVTPKVVKPTGVVEVSIATRWPSVSLAITTAVVREINEYNQRTRQGQATAERKFIEGRMAIAGTDLRDSEDQLKRFLRSNRELGGSPELIIERQRIQRDVDMKQQVFTSLRQSYEDARIREVRDTPVIMILEPPAVRAMPEARGRLKRLSLGILVGGIVGIGLALLSGLVRQGRQAPNPDIADFVAALAEVKSDWSRPLGWLRRRAR